MRVTNKMIMNNAASNINSAKETVNTRNKQMTSQKKIDRPSDDPVIAVRSLRLSTTLSQVTQYYSKNIPDATWFSRVLKPQMDKYPISYFLLWRNYEKEWFGPVPNTPCGADYAKAFKKSTNVMFLNDIK